MHNQVSSYEDYLAVNGMTNFYKGLLLFFPESIAQMIVDEHINKGEIIL